MRIFNRFWAIFIIAAKRILSQPGMAISTVLGMIFAISLSMSVPLYASSVYNSIFLQRVKENPADATQLANPPFMFLFTYDSSILGNLQWEDLARVNEYFANRAESVLGLPIKTYTKYFSTDPMALFPSGVEKFTDADRPLMWSSIAFMDNLADHITIAEGNLPQLNPGGPIQVMVSFDLATQLGLQVGEQYNMFARNQLIDGARTTVTVPVLITGVFQASDPGEEYWFIRPAMLKERLMVNEEIFAQQVSPMLSNEIYGAFWSFQADGSSVRPDQSKEMVYRIRNFEKQAGQFLLKIKMAVSPIESLYAYQRAANLLTVLLFAFSVPIFGLLLAFITMTSSMTVERQRNEIAILRSRGAMIAQMVGIATVECLLLGAISIAIALPVSSSIAWMIGRTRSFLDFSSPTGIELVWSPATLWFGVSAIILTMAARLSPTLQAARDNIVVYKRERARSLRPAFWQRMWLDVLLLIPAAYGMYQLRQSGSIDVLGASAKGDPFGNPLLMMVPALAIFSLSLFFLRLMPLVMSAITWLASRTRSVGLMMAARHLARSPSTYTLPLVLLILTLSLSAFTATLAGTLDHHLHDQQYYRIGADVNFRDLGDAPEAEGGGGGGPFGAGAPAVEESSTNTLNLIPEDPNPPGWFFLPVSDYVRLPGVTAATRVGRYQATALFGSSYDTGEILGVDRASLPGIAFWRRDFADDSLGELMNLLAVTPDGLLVTKEFMADHTLSINDLVTLRVVNYNKTTDVDFHVMGTFELFPTFYPGVAPLFVGNLDYIFMSAGAEYPYEVWVKTDRPVDVEELNDEAAKLIGARTTRWQNPSALIFTEQSRPERQGLFGVLSVGFGAAALLTVLGFLLYALLSYQRRFVELGVLRAVGLSAGQMIIFLAAELAFLILMGGLIGTVLGVWISNNFIPFLQIGADVEAQIPPYLVYIAWPAILRVYALFGVLFVVALTTLVVMLRRMRIFQAIKMGEDGGPISFDMEGLHPIQILAKIGIKFHSKPKKHREVDLKSTITGVYVERDKKK